MDQWHPKMHNSCSFSVTILISLWCFYTYSVLKMAANSKSVNNLTSRHLSTMDQWHPKMHNSCSFSVTILISLWCFYTYLVLKMAANSKSVNILTSRTWLKVSRSRKQILKFSLEPKNEQKYFCISGLASKKRSNQKNKGTLYH